MQSEKVLTHAGGLMRAPREIVIRARLPKGVTVTDARRAVRKAIGQPLEKCVTNLISDCLPPPRKA